MNKTVKKIVSMVVAMTFLLTMAAVPAGFAANADWGFDPSPNFGWKTAIYTDEACTTEATAVQPGDTVYVQFSLQAVRYFGAANGTLTVTGLTFDGTQPFRQDFAVAEGLGNYAGQLILDAAESSVSEKTAQFFITINDEEYSYPSNDFGEAVFPSTNTTDGVELKLLTYKATVDTFATRDAKVSAVFTPGERLGISMGECDLDYNSMSSVPASADKQVSASVGLPTIDSATLVDGNTGEEETATEIETPSTDDTGSVGTGYYFRAELSNGDTEYYPIYFGEPVENQAGAYVDLAGNDFKLADGVTTNEEFTCNVTISDPNTAADKDGLTIKFVILATQYRINPKDIPVIELPRGITEITAEDLGDSVQTSNDGTTWTPVDLTGKTITLDESFTNNGESITVGTETQVVVNISDITLQAENNKVTVKTIAPIANGKYQLAASEENPYVVYKATISEEEVFAQPLNLETGYSDGTFVNEGDTTATAELTYTITAENWKAFVDAAKAAEGDYTAAVKVTFNEEEVDIYITAKDAEPTGNYRVKAGQIFPLGYKEAIDTSAILFEQEIQKIPGDETSNEWVAYTPAGYTVALSSYDNTVAGSNTVTVSLVGEPAITLDPATITVNVTKEVSSYLASWVGGTPAAVTGMSEDEIKELIAIEATYAGSGVKELIAVDLNKLAIADYDKTSTAKQTLAVTYDGKSAGSLSLTLADAATTDIAITDVEIVGVDVVGDMSGTISVTAGEETITLVYGLSGNDTTKVMGAVADTVTEGDYAFTLSIPGFKPVNGTLHVTADDATIEIADGEQLLAGFVASTDGSVADKAAISSHDFYAIGSHLGESTSGNADLVKYDLNRDGKITQLDIDAMLSNYGA